MRVQSNGKDYNNRNEAWITSLIKRFFLLLFLNFITWFSQHQVLFVKNLHYPPKEFLSITNRFDMIDSLDVDVDVPWHPTYLPCSKKMQLYLFVWIKKLCSCISCQHMNHSYLSPLIYVDQQITQLSVVLVN